MGKANKKKQIQISIEYRSTYELSRILARIKKMAMIGIETYKERLNSSEYEYHLEFEQEENIEIRFEEINGKMNMIIPSKLNQ